MEMSESNVLLSSLPPVMASSETATTDSTAAAAGRMQRDEESEQEKECRRRSSSVFAEAAAIAAQHVDDSFPPLWVDQLPPVLHHRQHNHQHHGQHHQQHLQQQDEEDDLNIDVASDADGPNDIDEEDAAMMLDLDDDDDDGDQHPRHHEFVKRVSLDPTDTWMTHTDGNSTIAGSSFLGGWITGDSNNNGSGHPNHSYNHSNKQNYQYSNHSNNNEDETTFMDLDDTTTTINPDSDLWLDSMDDPMLPAILLVEHDPLIQQELLLDEMKRSSCDGVMGFYSNLYSQHPDSSSVSSSQQQQLSLQELFHQRRAQLAASMQRSRESRQYFYKIDLKSHIQQRCNLAKVLTEIEKSSRVLASQFRVLQQQQPSPPPLLETHAEEEGEEDEQQLLAELLSDLQPSGNSTDNVAALLPSLGLDDDTDIDTSLENCNGKEAAIVPTTSTTTTTTRTPLDVQGMIGSSTCSGDTIRSKDLSVVESTTTNDSILTPPRPTAGGDDDDDDHSK